MEGVGTVTSWLETVWCEIFHRRYHSVEDPRYPWMGYCLKCRRQWVRR